MLRVRNENALNIMAMKANHIMVMKTCVRIFGGGGGIQLPVGVYSAEAVYLSTVQLVANGI